MVGTDDLFKIACVLNIDLPELHNLVGAIASSQHHAAVDVLGAVFNRIDVGLCDIILLWKTAFRSADPLQHGAHLDLVAIGAGVLVGNGVVGQRIGH